MAKTLDSFDFTLAKASRRYPWTEWLDGRVWQLEAGVDFTCRPHGFTTAVRNNAKKVGAAVNVHIDGDTVIIQAQRRRSGGPDPSRFRV